MVVIIEYLGNEPIENLITCMHYKADKVVYFGYHDLIQRRKKSTENFLKKYCGVKKAEFHPLSRINLTSVLKSMRKEIERELSAGGKLYIDITGGEGLIPIAFGMLSKEFKLPMHIFDVPADKLVLIDEETNACISREAEPQEVELNLERYIEMKGGAINWGLHKGIKDDEDEEFTEDVEKLWEVAKKHINYWNSFSEFLRNNMVPDENLQVSKYMRTVLQALDQSANKMRSIRKLNQIADDLADAGILLHVEHSEGRYRFTFKNQNMKDCIWEGGSILELHVYQKQKKESTDCKAGVHLDWDGVIQEAPGKDVLNEIDVLSLNGNVPTFISCKSGKMGPQQVLHALYELDSVSARFGGKYAKEVLVTTSDIGAVYLERAAVMGIEVKQV